MSYSFRRDRHYRMPTHFGPSLGPRQGPDGKGFSGPDYCTSVRMAAWFEANSEQIDAALPPRFCSRAPHLVRFDFFYGKDIAWLAGRGYNTFGIYVPATFAGREGPIHGEFLLVLWENMADPIITGREDLGFAKLFCDIPPPQNLTGGRKVVCRASWDGFQFATLELTDLTSADPGQIRTDSLSAGILHYKYFPKTFLAGEADVEYAVLTPVEDPYFKLSTVRVAAMARGKFNSAAWEDMPTQAHIVNGLAGLELGSCVYACVMEGRGGSDLHNQRKLS